MHIAEGTTGPEVRCTVGRDLYAKHLLYQHQLEVSVRQLQIISGSLQTVDSFTLLHIGHAYKPINQYLSGQLLQASACGWVGVLLSQLSCTHNWVVNAGRNPPLMMSTTMTVR